MDKPSFGVIFHPKLPITTLVDYARQAESTGFDELWLWEDSFFAGAFTSAATALAGTDHIKVGIGIIPVVSRNPLFTAMEITTLACLYPGRFVPAFGHGVDKWMKQIGVYPESPLSALEETVLAVRRLLRGETVSFHGSYVSLDNVKMELVPAQISPIYVGGIREKSVQLAGRVGDGTILTEMASPAYVRWARAQVAAGMAEANRTQNRTVVYVFCKANPDGKAARSLARQALATRLVWASAHLSPLGIAAEAKKLAQDKGVDGAARAMPDEWVDQLSASGTPEQCAAALSRLAEAGADSIVLLPIDGDPAAMDEYLRYLLPLIKK
jgi:5,10-methylenetetrahydromethanopterin reductase